MWFAGPLSIVLGVAGFSLGWYSSAMALGCGPPRSLQMWFGFAGANALAIAAWLLIRRFKKSELFSTRAVGYAYVAGLLLGSFAP